MVTGRRADCARSRARAARGLSRGGRRGARRAARRREGARRAPDARRPGAERPRPRGEYGSVRGRELMAIERYSHVMHIVSDVPARCARAHADRRAARRASRPARSRARPRFARCRSSTSSSPSSAGPTAARSATCPTRATSTPASHPHRAGQGRRASRAGGRRDRGRLGPAARGARDRGQGRRGDGRDPSWRATRADWAVSRGAGHRQLRLLHLQPRPVPGRARRRARRGPQRRPRTSCASATPDRRDRSPGPCRPAEAGISKRADPALRRGRRAAPRRLPRPPGACGRVRRPGRARASPCTARPPSQHDGRRSSTASSHRSRPAAITRSSSTPELPAASRFGANAAT